MHVVEVPGVVPYVGTWIEITLLKRKRIVIGVVPYVGTWIEICVFFECHIAIRSFPTWERG